LWNASLGRADGTVGSVGASVDGMVSASLIAFQATGDLAPCRRDPATLVMKQRVRPSRVLLD
jgi:hypothetical protein